MGQSLLKSSNIDFYERNFNLKYISKLCKDIRETREA